MLKILLTSPTYPPFNSGLGNAVQQQAAALCRLGCSVVVATGGEQRRQRPDPVSGAVVEEFAVRGAEFLLAPIRGDIEAYVRFVTESEFDVLVMNAWQTWSTDLCLKNLNKISARKIVYSHCISTNTFLAPQPLRSLARYLVWRPYWMKLSSRMCQLDGIFSLAARGCDSRFDDVTLAQKLSVPLLVVPNSISGDALKKLDEPRLPYIERKYLIAIGAYEWQKGHDFVLRAYSQSRAKNKIPLRLYGQKFTRFTSELKSMARKLGISCDYLSLYEGVSGTALVDACRDALLLLSGSVTECQPLVLLDAMALGAPFVAKSTGSIPFMDGGIAVETEHEMAMQIDRLLSDATVWDELSRSGLSIAHSRHHPDVVGRALFEGLLAFGSRDVYH